MTDTFYTGSIIANDTVFIERMNFGAAKENVPDNPVNWVWDNRYLMAAAPGWAAAVDSWLASNPDADPPNGWATNQAVISDLQISSQIQALLAS